MLFDKLLSSASVEHRTSCLMKNSIEDHYGCVRCDVIKCLVRQLNFVKDVQHSHLDPHVSE